MRGIETCAAGKTRRWLFALVCMCMSWTATAVAQDASVAAHGESAAQQDLALVLGPRVGLHGPPTALAARLHYGRALYQGLAFHGVAGLTVSGPTTLDAEGATTPDPSYGGTVGGTFEVGARYAPELFAAAGLPFASWVRAAMLVDVTGGAEMVGYAIGTVAAVGLAYPIIDNFALVAELELGGGFGQYRAQGAELVVTLNTLLGVQMQF